MNFHDSARRYGALCSATTALIERARELRHEARNTRNLVTLSRALRQLMQRRSAGR